MAVSVTIMVTSCVNGHSKRFGEDHRAAFCAGLALDYVKLLDLTTTGEGSAEGVKAAPGFLKLTYTNDFVNGSPDLDTARTVVQGAAKAANGTLDPTDVDAYVDAFNKLKAANNDIC